MKSNTKRCGRCKAPKPFDAFPKDRTRPDGLGCYCKTCRNARNAKYRAEQIPATPEAVRYPEYVPFRCIQEVWPIPEHEVRR
jgi:hypothetical protein